MQNKTKVLTVALLLAVGMGLAPSLCRGQSYSVGNISQSATTCGSGGATNGRIKLHFPTSVGLIPAATTVTLTGTFSATLTFEQSADNGVTWVEATGSPQPSGAATTSTTSTGVWVFDVASRTDFCVRGSAYTSGTVGVRIESSPAQLSSGTGVGGLSSLNGLTSSSQTFSIGTDGTDFNVQSDIDTHIFNLPTAQCEIRGAIDGTPQVFCGNKTFQGDTLMDGDLYVTGNFSTDHPIEITGEACAVSEANVGLFGFDPTTGTPCFSYDGSAPAEIGTGGGGDTIIQTIGNGLLTGGGVVWTGLLNFTVAPATYLIAGNEFSSVLTDLTLDAADATNPRIDAIIVNDAGVATFITGTPAATPALPSVDAATQLLLTFVYVGATDTTPDNFSNVNLYLENTEWTSARSPATDPPWALASTNNPFAGSVDIEATTAASGNYVTLTKPAAGTENLGNYDSVSFRIRSKASWPTPKGVTLSWFNGTAQVGNPVVVKSGSYGFDSTVTGSYQLVSVPISTFNAGTNLVTTLRVTVTGGGGSIGFYLDNILLQGGAGPGVPSTVQFVDQVVPSGPINGVNTIYTLPFFPNPSSSVICYLNGLAGLQGASADYTMSPPNIIVYNSAPQTGDRLWCNGRH